jgi:acyl-[acyl-carrier-protein]-phospholipid O-acyltransferase/long-chain-fatty-acid--[acyl-carrier-protein] ligase
MPGSDGTPLIYVALHRRALDSLALSVLLSPRPVVVLPPEELRARLHRWLLRAVDHLVRDVNDPATVRAVLRILGEGRPVLLFPEGQVLTGGAVLKNYEVPALIAAKARATVVPVAASYARGRLPAVTLHLGHALRTDGGPRFNGGGARARRSQITRQLQRALEATALDARPRQSLFDAFLDAVQRYGPRTPIIEDMREEPHTYRQVLKGALAIGRWAAPYTQPRENVGLLLPNMIPTACAVLGLMAFGRVPAMLNYTAGAHAVRGACRAARLRTVITSRAFVEQARLCSLVGAISDLQLLYLEDLRGAMSLAGKIWLLAFAQWFPRRVTQRVDAHAPAVVMFTSGSEARPKGVVLSHDNILSNIRQIGTVLDFSVRDKVLNALPVYHSYSFCAGLMLCLVTGVKVFLYISPLRYRAIPDIAYRRHATYLFGTSTFLSYYARHAHPLDFHTVRYVISGGEKLGEDVARLYLDKFGLRVYEGYGATECAPVIALSTPQCYRLGTVGRLLPGIEHRLEPLRGIDHGGVLHLRGPNVMLGYYRYENPGEIEPPRSRLGPGWYETGDVVDIDQDGIVRVVGRVKRFAKVAGEMVSLDAIEQIARAVSPEHHHAVVVRTEAAGGEITVLFTTDPALTRHALMNAAREMGRPDLSVARSVIWMQDIPVLGSGKTDYVTLESVDIAESAANEPGEPVPPAKRDARGQTPG